MAKASLTYTLPEEEMEHRTALDGYRWKGVVYDLDNWLRGICKHGEAEKTDARAVREWLQAALAEEELNLLD